MKIKKLLSILLVLSPYIVIAQQLSSTGIEFEHGLSWEQVQSKAKQDHKGIFLDCYATWCGPCKSMDNDIYADEQVSKYMNEHFVSIKVQLDTTRQDDDEVRDHYAFASHVKKNYHINILPTFLFFF